MEEHEWELEAGGVDVWLEAQKKEQAAWTRAFEELETEERWAPLMEGF